MAEEDIRATPGWAEVPEVVGMEVHTARRLVTDADQFLEHPDADGRPLASGVIVRQEPSPGTVVERFTPINAWVRDAMPEPDFLRGVRGWDEDDGPSGGVREPGRPLPANGGASAEVLEADASDDCV
jgi:hypothetical protein